MYILRVPCLHNALCVPVVCTYYYVYLLWWCMHTSIPQDKLGTITEHRVRGEDLTVEIKGRRDKQARLAMVLKGREGREEFGAASKRKKSKQGGLSNRCVGVEVGWQHDHACFVMQGKGETQGIACCCQSGADTQAAWGQRGWQESVQGSSGAPLSTQKGGQEAIAVLMCFIVDVYKQYLCLAYHWQLITVVAWPAFVWVASRVEPCEQHASSIDDVAHPVRAAARAGCAHHVCGGSQWPVQLFCTIACLSSSPAHE